MHCLNANMLHLQSCPFYLSKPCYTPQSVIFYPCQLAHVAETQFWNFLVIILHHTCYRRVHICVCLPCIMLSVLCPKYFHFFSCLAMCCPAPGDLGCICPTQPCISFFCTRNGWWPYLAYFWGTYWRYTAGGCHPPWYFMMGPTDWHSAASVDPLPSHCLGDDTFINGLLYYFFSSMSPSLVPRNQTLSGSIFSSGESGLLKYLQILSNTPQNTCTRQSAPTFAKKMCS